MKIPNQYRKRILPSVTVTNTLIANHLAMLGRMPTSEAVLKLMKIQKILAYSIGYQLIVMILLLCINLPLLV